MSNPEKRVTFVLGGMSFGGAERVISILADHYAGKGWRTDIVTLLKPDCDFALAPGVRHIHLGGTARSRALRAPAWLWGLRKYLQREKPDTVVSFAARINCLVLLAAIGSGWHGRMVISERNDPSRDTRTAGVRFLTKRLYPRSDAIVFQTNRAMSYFPKPVRGKGQVIPNPVRVKVAATTPVAGRVVAVGKLMAQKDHAMLIRAFARIAAANTDATLSIYGDGPLHEELLALIRTLGMTERIMLEGWHSDVNEQIANARVFALSSQYEGLSNALMEALAMGICCVSTDCAGASDLIENGVNGMIVPVGGEAEMAKALATLLNDGELADRMAKMAAKRAEAFAIDGILARWEQVIER